MASQTDCRFVLEELIFNGGGGDVYRGYDRKHGCTVAIKILPTAFTYTDDALSRFKQEAYIAFQLTHPNIVKFTDYEVVAPECLGGVGYDAAGASQVHILVMEFIEGENLREHMRAGRLQPAEAVGIAIQAGRALKAAHRRGVVHRDLKPENVMVTDDGCIKVLDFGFAKLTDWFIKQQSVKDEGLTIPMVRTDHDEALGTPCYKAPEQWAAAPAGGESDVDERADVWGLGLILYEMLTDHNPFDARTTERARFLILGEDPPPLSSYMQSVPRGLQEIVSKALGKERASRYQSVGEMLKSLEEVKHELDYERERAEHERELERVRAEQERELERLRAEHGRELERVRSEHERGRRQARRVQLAGAVAGALLALLAVAFWLDRRPEPVAPAPAALTAQATPAPSPERPQDKKNVAVLPFEVSGGVDPALGRGVAETLKEKLYKLPQVNITVADPKDIGTNEHDRVITGTIRKMREGANDIIKITVNFNRGKDVDPLSFSGPPSEIFEMENAIANQVVGVLSIKPSDEQKKLITKRFTRNFEAYQAHVKGRAAWNKRTRKGFYEAIEHFGRAIEKDEDYLLPRVGLADCYILLSFYGYLSPAEGYARAKAEALEVVKRDAEGDLLEVYASLGYITAFYDKDWPRAEEYFEKALSRHYNYATGHHWQALFLARSGRPDEAERAIRLAEDNDPYSPIIARSVGLLLYYRGDYDGAIAKYKTTLARNRDFVVGYVYLTRAYAVKGDLKEAFAQLAKAERIDPGEPSIRPTRAWLYALAGRRAEALRLVRQLEAGAKSSGHYVSPVMLAEIYTAMDDREEAFRLLEAGVRENSDRLTLLKVDPVFERLRSDPRFASLKGRVGLS